jgi:TATA-box binding protein (TBP) (component of TFIID and TFIIIB)
LRVKEPKSAVLVFSSGNLVCTRNKINCSSQRSY